MKVYKLTEYGSFIAEKEIAGYTTLPKHTFEQLENFILINRGKKSNDGLELMRISAKRVGKVITARNYVGVITMLDGTVIEILPKIFSPEDKPEGDSEQKSKKILVEMLKTLRFSPFKTLQTSNVNIEKMNIFEIFIKMFIDEIFRITKRGLKCDYETIESNEKMFKGKLIFNEQIKMNYAHKERNYVEFDEYNINRSENRLIKSTLMYLYHKSSSINNKRNMKTLLNKFENVGESSDYEGDYAKFFPDRNMKDYQLALLLSQVFLKGKSFTAFSGSGIATSLLFPMETLFESYVALKLKKALKSVGFEVKAQDKSHHLFENPNKFLIKPDIVVIREVDKAIFIMDTKWKVLSNDKGHNYGISQSDMYQMYAYQKKYKAENVTLLYPLTDLAELNKESINYKSEDGADIRVQFIDLFNIDDSIKNIVENNLELIFAKDLSI